MDTTSIGIAFIGGVVSFISPCVLPIIPGFLAYLAGTSIEGSSKRFGIFLNSVCFVLGFSIVFAILGVLLNTVFAHTDGSIQMWLARAGGVVIIIFGLYLLGLLKLPFLERDYKFRVGTNFSSRYLTSILFGAAFAAGWTPCVGAVLGSIIALSAIHPGIAFSLFFAYAAGLGIPFLLVGLFTEQADGLIRRFGKTAKIINGIFGALLVILGVFAFTQELPLLFNLGIVNNIILK